MKNQKGKFFLLTCCVSLILTGCKEPEIIGNWQGDPKQFNQAEINQLFTKAMNDRPWKNASISSNKNALGVQFGISFAEPAKTEEEIKTILNRVEDYRSNFKSEVRFTLKNIDQITTSTEFINFYGSFAKLRSNFINIISKASDQPLEPFITELDWNNASMMVYGIDSRSDIYFPDYEKASLVYCKVNVPLTRSLQSSYFEKAFQEMGSEEMRGTLDKLMTSEEINEFPRIDDYISHFLKTGFPILSNIDSFDISFNEELFGNLKPISTTNKYGYGFEDNFVFIEYGIVENGYFNPDVPMDLGGSSHKKCEDMITSATPLVAKKLDQAKKYKMITGLRINPKWKVSE